MATFLGGSPLNLINLRSRPNTSTGRSTFPFDGNSVYVGGYNNSLSTWSSFDSQGQKGKDVRSSISIFSRQKIRFTPWPEIPKDNNIGDQFPNITNIYKDGKLQYESNPLNPSRLHSDQIYDTSILNLMDKTFGMLCELRSTHFAYLKDVGVYPNNRLVIGRRFPTSGMSVTNLMRKGQPAISTMICWIKEDASDFFNISFGEEWEEADSDFTQVLNDLSDDFFKGSGLGKKIEGGLGVLPLSGFTESIQRKIFEKLGIMKSDASSYIPAGEPNLIRAAKKRKTGAYGAAFTGLRCTFSVKMVCEWEQKFISGLDPTVVWLDIIQQVLRFGTSNSVTYGLSSGTEDAIMDFVNDPLGTLIKLLEAATYAITEFTDTVRKKANEWIAESGNELKSRLGLKSNDPNKEKSNAIEEFKSSTKSMKDAVASFADSALKKAGALLKRIIGKYRVRIEGILHSLVGSPSGPWHVTIGNPLRPVFSSGDMLISDTVQLSFGSTLAFNDLPSTIKAEFTLIPARPLGLQEIFARFNSGHIRSILPFPNELEKAGFSRILKPTEFKPKADDVGQGPDLKQEQANLDKFISDFYNSPDKYVGGTTPIDKSNPQVLPDKKSTPDSGPKTTVTPANPGVTSSTPQITATNSTPQTVTPQTIATASVVSTTNASGAPNWNNLPSSSVSPPVNPYANSATTYINSVPNSVLGSAPSGDIQVQPKPSSGSAFSIPNLGNNAPLNNAVNQIGTVS